MDPRRRRHASELLPHECWTCLCDKRYKRTSVHSISKHKSYCPDWNEAHPKSIAQIEEELLSEVQRSRSASTPLNLPRIFSLVSSWEELKMGRFVAIPVLDIMWIDKGVVEIFGLQSSTKSMPWHLAFSKAKDPDRMLLLAMEACSEDSGKEQMVYETKEGKWIQMLLQCAHTQHNATGIVGFVRDISQAVAEIDSQESRACVQSGDSSNLYTSTGNLGDAEILRKTTLSGERKYIHSLSSVPRSSWISPEAAARGNPSGHVSSRGILDKRKRSCSEERSFSRQGSMMPIQRLDQNIIREQRWGMKQKGASAAMEPHNFRNTTEKSRPNIFSKHAGSGVRGNANSGNAMALHPTLHGGLTPMVSSSEVCSRTLSKRGVALGFGEALPHQLSTSKKVVKDNVFPITRPHEKKQINIHQSYFRLNLAPDPGGGGPKRSMKIDDEREVDENGSLTSTSTDVTHQSISSSHSVGNLLDSPLRSVKQKHVLVGPVANHLTNNSHVPPQMV